LTAGSESDFRYFLPRILEISVRDGSWWPGREVVLGKLTLADWKAWPEHLRDPVIRLCEAAFDEALRQADDPGGQIDSWICGLSRAGLDVLPYLEKLRAPGAEKALIGFFEANSAALLRGKLANAFWKDEKADPAPVIAWLNSPDVQSAVWSHYGANPR
jgi:hypothetical protein